MKIRNIGEWENMVGEIKKRSKDKGGKFPPLSFDRKF